MFTKLIYYKNKIKIFQQKKIKSDASTDVEIIYTQMKIVFLLCILIFMYLRLSDKTVVNFHKIPCFLINHFLLH